MNQVKGRHLIIDAFDCDSALLDDLSHLEQILTNIVTSLGMEKLAFNFHRFEPHGITGLFLLSTSHLSIHTWPEYSYAALDLFTCGDSDPSTQIDTLLRGLSAKSARIYGIERTNGSTTAPVFWEYSTGEEQSTAQSPESSASETKMKPIDLTSDRGDLYDQIERRQVLAGDHNMLFQGTSSYQHIELVEASEMRMYLDGQLQFSSLDERIYHEALVHPAFAHAASHERVLIVGGGDGLALREVLKYKNVKHVDLVDLDSMVLEVAKTVPKVVSLNESSMHDPRVTVHPVDANMFIDNVTTPYHIIIVDFPDPADEIISTIYTKEFFQQLSNCLGDNGVLVCQSFSPEDAPLVYWSIGLTIGSAGLHTKAYHCLVPSFGDWGFHLAGRDPIPAAPQPVSVPTQTLPENLSTLFAFPDQILEKRDAATINTMQDLKLHEIYQMEAGKKN
ncbi:adenosylmethionine decarboxylase [Brevibacillus choshinensis]|uniref:S-adenosylmethionine decarboxylase proenzyme n=1 Tax=Brevibacillus choshinensis TaxID=54911 RepID=A0ABX7FUN6_BRECH|nr:adenosylmethionine decarboxylase [Brevibacillus choshinensis]QRG68695.1 adenosylmethionine decarboxylase [Brevibacillus choshinensis]